MRTLGVVVLVYGSRDDHLPLVSGLLADGVAPAMVAVVHNPKVTTEPNIVSGHRDVEVIRAITNRGYAAGMNLGIRHHLQRGASDLLLLTQDLRFSSGSVMALLKASRKAPDFGVLGPSMWWPGDRRPFSYGGIASRGGAVGHLDFRPPGDPHGIAECDWIDGAAMLIRNETLRVVGLLDERFFMYFEETELCLRAARAGWRIGVVLDARAEQIPGGGKRPGAYQYLLTRNGLAYAREAAGARGLTATLARRIGDGIELLMVRHNARLSLAVRSLARVEFAATWRGVVDYLLGRWGPPPSGLAGLGDVATVRSPDSRRCVIVSTFPPRIDGIARYAEQLAISHAGERTVLRIGLPGSVADRVRRLDGGLRPLRILSTTHASDEIVLMWHPEFYISGGMWSRTGAYLAIGTVLRARAVSVVMHEPDRTAPDKRGPARKVASRIERVAQRWCWASPARLMFHSEHERREFVNRFPRTAEQEPVQVISHGAHFRPYTGASRNRARQMLGLKAGNRLFLCIGFLGRHKGFDRAVRAFGRLPAGVAELHIIGSPLYDTPEVRKYVGELRSLVATVPGAHLREQFLDDSEFDLWVRAANAVLVPYLSASSSGVIARARLLGTSVVASRVGGLPEQLGPKDIVVESDEQLATALERLAILRGAEN
jgi:GT2 family glycosyltransferase/glycosyltransferase involved in cell wall biosynthesis